MKCPVCGYSTEKKKRSNNQNRFYRGIVIPLIADHTGYAQDEVHEILKFAFLIQYKKVGNKELSYVGSTADLNTVQFEEYIVKIREWAWNTLQVQIPNPNEPPLEDLA